MTFLSPWWLAGLIPWLAVSLWLLWGRRRRRRVPFLALWENEERPKRAKRFLETPPVALAALLAAMLLAILAAAGPQLSAEQRAAKPAITLIVDRSLSMSAFDGGVPRFRSLARLLAAKIKAPPARHVELIFVPPVLGGGQEWTAEIEAATRTAVSTDDAVRSAVAGALERSTGMVVAITDVDLAKSDDRLVQVAPENPWEDVTIVRLAARVEPRAQIMVAVRNSSQAKNATLHIRSGPIAIDRDIELPPHAAEQIYFIDLPKLSESIDVQVDGTGALEAGEHAYLARESSWPKLEARTPLPPNVVRLMDAYRRVHPSSAASTTVMMARAIGDLPADSSGIAWLSESASTSSHGEVSVVDHALTRSVDWPTLLASATLAPDPGDGWRAIVRIGYRAAVAVRESDARQVWFGFDSPDIARSAELVKFWQNAIDWLGQGGERFTDDVVRELDPSWMPATTAPADADPRLWPGVFRRSDQVMAMNAQVRSHSARRETRDWASRLDHVTAATSGNLLTPWCILATLVCGLLAAATWRREDA